MSARDPASALLRAIGDHAAACGLRPVAAAVAVEDWASATFVGYRIRYTFAVEGTGVADWAACLPDVEWHVPRHLVADLAVDDADPACVALSLLVLIDR